MVVSSFTSGLLLVAVGFLGEYTWRILDEVRGAPPFLEGRSEQVAAQRGRSMSVVFEPAVDRRPGMDPRRLSA